MEELKHKVLAVYRCNQKQAKSSHNDRRMFRHRHAPTYPFNDRPLVNDAVDIERHVVHSAPWSHIPNGDVQATVTKRLAHNRLPSEKENIKPRLANFSTQVSSLWHKTCISMKVEYAALVTTSRDFRDSKIVTSISGLLRRW